MGTIEVRTSLGSSFECTVGINDCCLCCGNYIVWGADRRGTPVALEPWGDSETETEPHFNHCQQLLERRADLDGIEIPLSTWRGLLMLCHPDRYAGTVNEKLANRLTQWLLAQRGRLIEEMGNEYAE